MGGQVRQPDRVGVADQQAEDAVAVGLLEPVDNLEGIYDLTLLNKVLADAGQPQVGEL